LTNPLKVDIIYLYLRETRRDWASGVITDQFDGSNTRLTVCPTHLRENNVKFFLTNGQKVDIIYLYSKNKKNVKQRSDLRHKGKSSEASRKKSPDAS